MDNSQYEINLQQARGALDLAQANYVKLPDDIQSAGISVEKSQIGVTTAQAQYESAQAQYRSAQAQYRSAQTAMADAERQLNHSRTLFAAGAVARESLDTAQSNCAVLRPV